MEKYDITITKKNFFSTIEYAQQQQKVILPIFHEFNRICHENQIGFALCEGSLLGAVRHSGIIPWDDDIDIYMNQEQINNLDKVILNNKRYSVYKIYPGVYFFEDSILKSKIDIMTDIFKQGKYIKTKYINCVFEKINTLIPEDYIEILNKSYSDWQKYCYVSNHKIGKRLGISIGYSEFYKNRYLKISLKTANDWIKEYAEIKKTTIQ